MIASPPAPPPQPSVPKEIGAARIRALRAAAPGLPLATTGARGEPLRWRVREEEGEARRLLLEAWREALEVLHAAGLGTDGALAATLLLRGGRIAFDPDRVWPLGARRPAPALSGSAEPGPAEAEDSRWPIARPVAAWLDIREVGAWLEAAGHDAPHPFSRGTAPFVDGTPDAPAEGGVRIVTGPVAETLAIAAALGLDAVAAASAGRTDAAETEAVARALAGDGTIVVAVADDAPEALPSWLVAASRTRLATFGGPPPLDDADAQRFGLAPTPAGLQKRPAAQDADSDALRRRLEESDLIADPPSRHRARAALTAKVAHPDLDAAKRNREAAVALARTAGDRRLLADALLDRAMGGFAFDASAALKDATEGRRLAATLGDPARTALGAALERLLARLEGGRAPLPDGDADTAIPAPAPAPSSGAPPTRRGTAAIALDAVRRWASGATPGRPGRALNLAGLTGHDAVVAMVAELSTWRALGEGRELAQERLLGELVAIGRRSSTTRDVSGATRMATALAGLLAARRGAELTATDHLVALGDAPRLPPRVGAIAAIAARAAGMDALASRLGHAAGDTSTPARLMAHAPPLGDPEAGVLALFAELLVGRPEAEIRRHLPLFETRAAAWVDAPREAGVPVGLLVAAGTALATLGERRAEGLLWRALAAGDLEELVELRALSALAWILPEGSDEGRAVAARLESRATLRPSATGPRGAPAAPPLSAREAMARVVEAVETWTAALAHQPGGGGHVAALESLLGPLAQPAPEGLGAISPPFAVREGAGGGVTLTIGGGDGAAALQFEGPLPLPPDVVGRLVAALTPLLPRTGPPEGAEPLPDPGIALDAALSAGEVDFMRDVRPRFARHELTRETVRSALRLALSRTGGLYTAVADGWGVGDYQRFMDFLRRNGCLEDFRPFRRGAGGRDPTRTAAGGGARGPRRQAGRGR